MGTQLNFDKLLESKSTYGPTLNEYIEEYAKQNGELPSFRTLKSARFGDSKHNLRVIIEQKSKKHKLPIPEDFEDNYNSEIVITKSNYSDEESNNVNTDTKMVSNDVNGVTRPEVTELVTSKTDTRNDTMTPKGFTIKYSGARSKKTFYRKLKKIISDHGLEKVRRGIINCPEGIPQELIHLFHYYKIELVIIDDTTDTKMVSNDVNGVNPNNGSIPHNGSSVFNDWIQLPFPIPTDLRDLFTILIGYCMAQKHSISPENELYGRPYIKALKQAFKQTKEQLEKTTDPTLHLYGGTVFEECGGVPAAFFEPDQMHIALSCISELNSLQNIEEVTHGVFLKRRPR